MPQSLPSTDLFVAVAQISSGPDLDANKRRAFSLIKEAAAQGADLILFPENTFLCCPPQDKLKYCQSLEGDLISSTRDYAAKKGIAVLIGSFIETSPAPTHHYQTSVFIDQDGEITAVYRKIHLFDVNVPPNLFVRESDTIMTDEPRPCTADLGDWCFGLSICYDLRFPELYRHLVEMGAHVLLTPAAFTFRTGADHWHVLQRARAIENLSYVIAPNQVGIAYPGYESFGHSLIVSPWGEIVAQSQMGLENCVILQKLSCEALKKARAYIPALQHRCLA